MGTADKTYYLDAGGNLTEDSQKGATILINEGQEIPKEMADKYGIGKVAQPEGEARVTDTARATKPETVTDAVAGDAKASQPAANKAKKAAKNK